MRSYEIRPRDAVALAFVAAALGLFAYAVYEDPDHYFRRKSWQDTVRPPDKSISTLNPTSKVQKTATYEQYDDTVLTITLPESMFVEEEPILYNLTAKEEDGRPVMYVEGISAQMYECASEQCNVVATLGPGLNVRLEKQPPADKYSVKGWYSVVSPWINGQDFKGYIRASRLSASP